MKTIIITGATGNLGTVVTRKFLDSGYSVIATVITDAAKNDIPAHENLQVEKVNLSDEAESAFFVQSVIDKYKQVDAALMLVGGFMAGGIGVTSGADLKNQFALNFETAYNITRPLYLHMQQKESGRLVFIGARPVLEAKDGKSMLAYGLTKSLLFKLAEYLNEDAKGKNIIATVVVPSTLDTPFNRKSMPAVNPADWVSPQQLAEVLEFVVSEKGSPLRETLLKVYNNA